MQVARLTFAARRRSDRSFRIFPLTIYEAKFREKLTNKFLCSRSDRLENQPGHASVTLKMYTEDEAKARSDGMTVRSGRTLTSGWLQKASQVLRFSRARSSCGILCARKDTRH